MDTSPQLSWIRRSRLAPFPGCQCSSGIVPNGPTGSVVSFKIHQGLKCKHVGSTPTLTMWLLFSNCALPWTTKFWGVFSKTDNMSLQQCSLYDPRPSAEFSSKMHKFLRSLAEYFAALTSLCFYVVIIFLTHILTPSLLALPLYMCISIDLNFFVFIVLNSDNFGRIQIYFMPKYFLFWASNFYRVLRPLKPLLGPQNNPGPPSSVHTGWLRSLFHRL